MYKIEDLKKLKENAEKVNYQFLVSGDKWMLVNLKKGTVAGHHHHKGLVKTKNPEIAILIKGKIEYFLKDVNSNETTKFVVEAPKIIKINPNVYHELKALEDVSFIEPQSEGDEKDTVRLK